MLQRIKDGGNNEDLRKLSTSVTCFYELALQEQALRNTLRALAAVQKNASTIQTGAPAGSNGTTSAVSKPITPLSLATEYGGITSSTSNQTMTLQTTLDGIPSALATHGISPYCISPLVTIPGCVSRKNLQLLNRFGVGVTANTSSSSQNVKGTAAPAQGTAQPASLTSAGTTAASLSSVFAKTTIWRGAYKLPAQGPPGKNLEAAKFVLAYGLSDLDLAPPDKENPPKLMTLLTWKNYRDWQRTCVARIFTKEKLKSASTSEINDLFFRYYARIVGILFRGQSGACSSTSPPDLVTGDALIAKPDTPQGKELVSAFETYIAAASLFEAQLDQMVLAAAAPVLSFEYDYNTPVNQPTTSTVKLLLSKAGLQKKCTSKQTAFAVTTTRLPDVKVNQAYSAALKVSGGLKPYSWILTAGSLPIGLTLGTDGTISGTPTVDEQSMFTVKVDDYLNQSATAKFSINTGALTVTTASLADAPVDHSYKATIAAKGGRPPYAWSTNQADLPPGLSMNAAGEISGTPTPATATTKSAVFGFTVQVVDSDQPKHTATAKLNIDVSSKPKPCDSSSDGACMNQLTLTLNAGGNFYNSAPSSVPGAGAFRDAQVGAELDYAVCTSSANPIWSFMANATFGLAYYYQDQVSPSILKVTPGMSVSGINIVGLASTTSSVFSKKGPINFAQFKYGLGTGKNVKFPIAFSYSNRTDLITKPLWSAQFGVSYDFSSLLNSSSSSNTSAADSKSP
jgi:hypothetical protein